VKKISGTFLGEIIGTNYQKWGEITLLELFELFDLLDNNNQVPLTNKPKFIKNN